MDLYPSVQPLEHKRCILHFLTIWRLTCNQQILHQKEAEKNLWIVKPTNLSRGRGIYIIDDISEVNIEEDAAIISKYVANPLLINGHKFDLRIYVLVTSYEPLRIYVYQEGLVRFASEQYTTKDAKTNIFNQLTNYSINKKS